MHWARTHQVLYFGLVVDIDLAEEFHELRMGIQPTEETINSSGVKEFHRQVLVYLTGKDRKAVSSSFFMYTCSQLLGVMDLSISLVFDSR